MNTRQAIAYTRVSTSQQATDGVSLDAQAAKIAAWSILTDTPVVQTFVDEGLSGTRADRPGLQAAVAAVCACKGVLVVYSLSRLARSTRLTLDLADRLEKAGADLVSLSEHIDTTSAAGKMVFRLLAVLNEFERDLIAERTATAMQHKKAQGQRISGRLPYGYHLAADHITLEEDPAEQAVIRAARQYGAAGLSLREISRRLTADGYASRTGQPFTHKTITAMLKEQAA